MDDKSEKTITLPVPLIVALVQVIALLGGGYGIAHFLPIGSDDNCHDISRGMASLIQSNTARTVENAAEIKDVRKQNADIMKELAEIKGTVQYLREKQH